MSDKKDPYFTGHKRCLICDLVFWATRCDARTCSIKCRKRLNRYMRGELRFAPELEMRLVEFFNRGNPTKAR